MGSGVLADLECDDLPEITGPGRLAWIDDRIADVMRHSNDLVAASVAMEQAPWFDQPGLYFLIWHGRVCYVGQAACIGHRLMAHWQEGRPIERVAVILGLPKWAQDEFEHAYASAWDLPWNAERSRVGQLSEVPNLTARAAELDRSAVMPWFTPTVTGTGFLKRWQLHVLGYQQAHPTV